MIETLDDTNAEWADGRALLTWLDGRGVKLRPANPSERRKLERWRGGAQARFRDVDSFLIAADVHPSEVPIRIWCRYRNGRSKKKLVSRDGDEVSRTASGRARHRSRRRAS
jgi:hypothetical protein